MINPPMHGTNLWDHGRASGRSVSKVSANYLRAFCEGTLQHTFWRHFWATTPICLKFFLECHMTPPSIRFPPYRHSLKIFNLILNFCFSLTQNVAFSPIWDPVTVSTSTGVSTTMSTNTFLSVELHDQPAHAFDKPVRSWAPKWAECK